MRHRSILALFAAALSATACAYYGDYGYGGGYGDYSYMGDAYGPAAMEPHGAGADTLDPWLAGTEEGRRVVMLGFDGDDDGRLTAETARRANVWFRRYADSNRDMELTDEEIRIALVQASLG